MQILHSVLICRHQIALETWRHLLAVQHLIGSCLVLLIAMISALMAIVVITATAMHIAIVVAIAVAAILIVVFVVAIVIVVIAAFSAWVVAISAVIAVGKRSTVIVTEKCRVRRREFNKNV